MLRSTSVSLRAVRGSIVPLQRSAFLQARSLKTFAAAAQECSYARGLFFGENNVHQAFPFPETLSAEAKENVKMIIDPLDKFFEENVDSKKIDKQHHIDKEVIQGLAQMGLCGLQIPQEYEGSGFGNTAYARVLENLSKDASVAVTLMAHQSIGLKPILLYGTKEQKAKYLPKLATGEHLAAFALTEPGSGSDAQSMKTRAKLSECGKYYVINGNKIWITNGSIAQILVVFAMVEVNGKDKVTAFIVDKDTPGFSAGPPEEKMGIRGSNTTSLFFDDMKVPVENILDKVGSGFKVALNTLNEGRFGVGAASAGAMKRMMGMAAEHANERVLFGKPIATFGLIKDKLATMAIETYAVESMTYLTSQMIDRGDPECYVEAAMCKVYGSAASWRVMHEVVQVLGGNGYMSEYPYERNVRDNRILSIFEGTNEILRMLIALSGIKGVGDRLKDVSHMATNPFADPKAIFGEIKERAQHHFPKGELSGVHPTLAEPGAQLRKDTALFGEVVDSLVRNSGKHIVSQQQQLARVADAAIDLYTCTAVLSRATRALTKGLETAPQEQAMATAYCRMASSRLHQSLKEVAAGDVENGDKGMRAIADMVCKSKGLPASSCIDID